MNPPRWSLLRAVLVSHDERGVALNCWGLGTCLRGFVCSSPLLNPRPRVTAIKRIAPAAESNSDQRGGFTWMERMNMNGLHLFLLALSERVFDSTLTDGRNVNDAGDFRDWLRELAVLATETYDIRTFFNALDASSERVSGSSSEGVRKVC